MPDLLHQVHDAHLYWQGIYVCPQSHLWAFARANGGHNASLCIGVLEWNAEFSQFGPAQSITQLQ